ncbi:cupin domain-containing protein [Filomicrobium sp.]|uniref:cupin domain-containing protein n=1 Tax=Filomicrobium sp. TaxID=2024831 RepID=UPI00258BE444|nr:cupin domain-containing protein [Filomicrobium sp.]MCV0370064.1 cupin domain-containing protein [Filomicrobium sp.]
MDGLTADEIIVLLGLEPHPEGGHFRETYRDPAGVAPFRGGERAASTAIYFLLRAGEVSRWHTVDAAEVWHHYAGAPLELGIAPPDGAATRTILGKNLAAGERPQGVVPAGHWQQARSLGTFSLVGCTVAPGFEFSSFVMAPEGFEPGGESPSGAA